MRSVARLAAVAGASICSARSPCGRPFRRPRDIDVVVRNPVYRIYFWNAGRSQSWEFELTGARSVHEVIDWARGHADDREFDLLVADGGTAYVLINLTF